MKLRYRYANRRQDPKAIEYEVHDQGNIFKGVLFGDSARVELELLKRDVASGEGLFQTRDESSGRWIEEDYEDSQ